MAGDVSFQTVVLDDQEEYANNTRFPTADQVVLLESFENCMDVLDINGDSYLVIVTRGHTHDRTILEQALKTKAGYIGMLGSKGRWRRSKKPFCHKASTILNLTGFTVQSVYPFARKQRLRLLSVS
jgi:xanthine dehydrogenase accessory factor